MQSVAYTFLYIRCEALYYLNGENAWGSKLFDTLSYVHEVLVNRLGGLSLPRKSVVRLTDRPDMTLDVYRGRKTTIQQQQQLEKWRNLRLTQKLQKVIREI